MSVLILVLSSCSTKRNTWASRTFHSTTTKYNIAFNGEESYHEGLKKIIDANEDDFSNIIPMYPISKHSNASAATSDMDRTIEKGRKAIKTHSIKQKPKRDLKKWSDPEYQAFYQQKEFNPALKSTWMLIGKAEFHKADFLGSVGTFSYVAKHYDTDKELIAQCQLWTVRAYVEMDWMYEAEELYLKVNQDDLKHGSIGLYAATSAVLLLKQQQYKEAIPFLEMVLSREKNKAMKQRFTFLLAQLYQETGNKDAALKHYTNLIKMNPPYIMDFNARLNRAQLAAGNNMEGVLKDFRKMLKNSNNKDYLDQIYYAMGNVYLQRGDTTKAIENYDLSIESSTRNGIDKATTLIKLGDLYYYQKKYIDAQPSYAEASTIITNEHHEYRRVTKLAEVLSELSIPYGTVILQDSLQHLSTLSPDEQKKIVDKIIEDLIAEEKRAKEKAEELARRESEERFVPVGGPLGADAGKWYFYNPNLVKNGKSEFQRIWGNRKLEDNWRRTDKTAGMFGSDPANNQTEYAEGELPDESQGEKAESSKTLSDKDPEYYLRQIPSTAEQFKQSNDLIADGLLSMGMIYKDKLNELPLAIETYNEFIRRFGMDNRVPDAYFQLFLIATKEGDALSASNYRTTLINGYPDSRYAQILAQPDYVERFNQMQIEQDSLYAATYQAYSNNEFATVFKNVEYAKSNYPSSALMPKFLFLEALTIGKTDTPDKFEASLNDLVASYPQSDVSSMAKDIAALLRQGREAQLGTSHGTLLTRRADELKAELEEAALIDGSFSAEKQTKHRLLLISSAEQQDMYQLMYQIAAFNFTRFMVKEFDLLLNALDETHLMLSVTNFESYDEVIWYVNSINADLTLSELTDKLGIEQVIISDENFDKLRFLGLDEYRMFEATNLRGKDVAIKRPATPAQKPTASQEKQQETKPVEAKPAAETKPAVKIKSTEAQADKEATLPPTQEPAEVSEAKIPEAQTMPEELQKEAPIEAPVEAPAPQEEKQVVTPAETVQEEDVQPEPAVEEEPEEDVPLFKGLFGYQPEKPHYVALYVISGKVNFDKIKNDFDTYNATNYSMLNLSLSLETVGTQQVVIVGSFPDANIAKSYLFRIVKEKELFEGAKGTNYRTVLGTQKNLNVMIQNNALKTYNEFMQEFYLK